MNTGIWYMDNSNDYVTRALNPNGNEGRTVGQSRCAARTAPNTDCRLEADETEGRDKALPAQNTQDDQMPIRVRIGREEGGGWVSEMYCTTPQASISR